ncbi:MULTISPECIES: histone-like nucleoid-structuring protein Lsr2 [Mycolicibacterium]|uniref:histone-like nucleoid-structuring protein Lsr2 n=1 Tax=Mycolicibacterium TaxID=1866885 RepID=UPI0008488395|nr:Lsr2 family protein [Mycolicibacterium porcinum]ODR25331.1 hypothetical protein BHQ19_12740 [Mycolicibacterium porcinum]
MAEKVVRLLIDDISGEELKDGEGERLDFTWRGVTYRIDLSSSNVAKFEKAIQPYVNAAAKVSGGRGRPKGSGSGSKSSMPKEQRNAIRTWANANGFSVGDRGRISQEVIDAFEAAHESKPAFSSA